MKTGNISKYVLHFVITFIAVLAAIFIYQFIEKPKSMTEKMDEKQIESIRQKTSIINGFEIARRFQTAIEVYWQTNNSFPISNKTVGLPAPGEFTNDGDVVEWAEIVAQGTIKIVYNEQSGIKNGVIYLIPDNSHAQTAGLQWHCVSPDFSEITQFMAHCDYKPGFVPEAVAGQ